MTHRNAPRACASKWVNRYRRYGDLGLLDRSSTPHDQLNATAGEVVARIEGLCRTQKWSAARISFELTQAGTPDSRRTVSRHLANLGLNRLRLIDPSGDTNREPRRIIARRPGHMVHVDVKKVGRIPDGGGCVPTVATATRPERSPGARRRPNAAATSTGTQPSTDTAASPTPKHCPTRRQRPRSHSCTGLVLGLPPTESPTSNESSLITAPAREPAPSPEPYSDQGINGSRPTHPDSRLRGRKTSRPRPLATFSQNLEWELRRKTRAMAAAAGKVTAECPKDLGSKSGTEVSCTSTYSGLELMWDVHIGDASEWSDSVVQYTAVPRKGLLTRDGIVRYFYGNSSADEVRCNAIPEAVLVPLNQHTSYECQNVYKDKGPMVPKKVKATDSGPSQVF
jgi:hypothetical protein